MVDWPALPRAMMLLFMSVTVTTSVGRTPASDIVGHVAGSSASQAVLEIVSFFEGSTEETDPPVWASGALPLTATVTVDSASTLASSNVCSLRVAWPDFGETGIVPDCARCGSS